MLPVNGVPGLAFICRMCTHMAGAVSKGLSACGKAGCGGFSVGRAFPFYAGPLESVKLDYCHRCGDESTQVIEIEGTHRLGVCAACLQKILDNDHPDE
jgi:hypothetical protein